MLDKTRCYKGGSQHQFRPRYTEIARLGNITIPSYFSAEECRKMTTIKQYVGDVCEWCGKTANKPKN